MSTFGRDLADLEEVKSEGFEGENSDLDLEDKKEGEGSLQIS
jgi:hypothetical protein